MEDDPLRRRSLLTVLAAAAAPATARAAGYPDRAIRLVVPFPPGGTPDILARLLAPELGLGLGQPVVVENRAGASGVVGTEAVARAAPDGHTLMMGSAATHALVPNTFGHVPYDPVAGFTALSMIAETANILVVNPDFPAGSVAELLALARSRPGTLNFGSTSVGGTPHMSGELLKLRTGIDMVHVPYRGAAPMLSDLLGGHLSMAFDNLPSSLGGIRDGSLRALAVTTASRAPALPEVPTMQDSGVAGFDVASWFALFGPAGLPEPVADRLGREVAGLLARPELRRRLADTGATPTGSSAAELAARVRREVATWREVVRASGLVLQ